MFSLDLTALRCDCVDVRCSELSALCDVLTMEIEHVNCDILEELEKGGAQVEPSSRTVRTIQDKFLQKQHMVEVRMCHIASNQA
jgi:phosphoribosylaminoimidazole carboxylase (NCAIR synthetase)